MTAIKTPTDIFERVRLAAAYRPPRMQKATPGMKPPQKGLAANYQRELKATWPVTNNIMRTKS